MMKFVKTISLSKIVYKVDVSNNNNNNYCKVL